MDNRVLNKIFAGMLFLAVLPMPSKYYLLLRIVICGAALYCYFDNQEEYKQMAKVGFILIAIIFNPIMPFYLNKISWVAIDIGTGLLFLWLNSPKSRNWWK